MKRVLASVLALLAIAAIAAALPAAATAGKKNKKTFVVCERGCKYPTVTKAVKKVKKKNSTIKVKPGTYKEGVILKGSRYDGLTITGTKSDPTKTVFEGKNAKSPEGLAQNAIEGIDVKNVTVKNLTAQNYATNGIFFRDSDAGDGDKTLDCRNYLVKNTYTAFNRAYNVFAFGCVGGRMTENESTGTGDSAYYVGATPPQKDPVEMELDHNIAYLNNQAFSGTNSRYIDIHHNDFFNNGIGLTPNTLDSEPYEPSDGGVIRKNNIFWNNLNYYLPNTPVETISNGLGQIGDVTINFPTGIGIVMFGVENWTVKNNNIFGHFKWGVGGFSDPVGNEGGDALSAGNRYLNNQMGRNGTDTNAVDFFVDGSGEGNCFSGNVSSTFDPSGTHPNSFLYPSCPAPPPPASGTGTIFGDDDQTADLISYVLATPPENQQCSWTEHPHPPFEDYEPYMVEPGPDCGG